VTAPGDASSLEGAGTAADPGGDAEGCVSGFFDPPGVTDGMRAPLGRREKMMATTTNAAAILRMTRWL